MCHCIEHNGARSERGDKLPFQDIVEHLEGAIGERIHAKDNPVRNPNEKFRAYLNFRG
ncbi:hypothetical protein GO684_03355 [Wolbachia endosymbiont of Litomosoides brasiliensis]|uniref:hypothetical protein n=1 Tax=Wolbachia endosymbiont of Litomosoides brasiliensis TaxID=1812117 RepID=UPI00158D48BB|nr:hypothetical protein [Wolbachia endosymbiont of Litomosoides brasiliensis]NUY39688.1 hypothetical protein [Wolbachia endosymbiont of Litomosoides brasiliensis]